MGDHEMAKNNGSSEHAYKLKHRGRIQQLVFHIDRVSMLILMRVL